MIVASARAHLPADKVRQTRFDADHHPWLADSPLAEQDTPEGPTPTALLVAALATCTAMSARTFLERQEIELGDVDVEIEYDMEPPVTMYRTITLSTHLSEEHRGLLRQSVDSTPITTLVRASLTVQTSIETPG